MYLTVIQTCVTISRTYRSVNANPIMTIDYMLMTAHRAKSIKIGTIDAKIAMTIHPKSHNGFNVNKNNGANIAIPLGLKTESLISTSERGTLLCDNLVSLANQWSGCQKVQG